MTDRLSQEARIRQLEESIAHQEHHYQQLNEVVLNLREDIDTLKTKLTARIERLEETAQNQSEQLDPNEKPPHY